MPNVPDRNQVNVPDRAVVNVPDRAPAVKGGVNVPDSASPIESPRSSVKKPASKPATLTDQPVLNGRSYKGGMLGVEIDGRVHELPKETMRHALVGDRILDTTPWTGFPIVEL